MRTEKSAAGFMRTCTSHLDDGRHRTSEYKQALVHAPEQALASAGVLGGERVKQRRLLLVDKAASIRLAGQHVGVGVVSVAPRARGVRSKVDHAATPLAML